MALATQSGYCILLHSSTHSVALYFFYKKTSRRRKTNDANHKSAIPSRSSCDDGREMFGVCEHLFYKTLAVFFVEILASLAHTTIQILVLASA